MNHTIDPTFINIINKKHFDQILSYSDNEGASYAELRCMSTKYQNISLKSSRLEQVQEGTSYGYSIRLIYKGSWGFASTTNGDIKSLQHMVDNAIRIAKATINLNIEDVLLADEPSYTAEYISDYKINPFEVPVEDKVARLTNLSNIALNSHDVHYLDTDSRFVQENTYFANTTGSKITQQRVRTQGIFTGTHFNKTTGQLETMQTLAPPVGRGWEYYLDGGYDFENELHEMPDQIKEKLLSPSIESGQYDLVIHPSNLWLTIHESVGHATEYDRAIGYEANYAGTSFATPDKKNVLQYGSSFMNITGDRTTPNGLSTIGYDDEGVAAQKWDIIKNGILVDYQLNRQMAHSLNVRSNGCAYSDSFTHVPLQRMPNVSLAPSEDNITLDNLLSDVENGIYIVGNKSWSIDMQRLNFQFTGQRFYKIKNGKLAGQVNDVAYQGNTIDFWNSLDGIGGKDTYILGGAFNCGKGQPGQVAPVSHGAPVARFRNIKVLNTRTEGAS